MIHLKKGTFRAGKRLCALFLCLCMLLSLYPSLVPDAHAAESDYYLDRLVSWDIMRGDQFGNLEPNRSITRAEFVTMLNRTFGYTKTGAQPFRDVVTSDWYYDDISAAYTAGYFQGTSRSTASPNATLTREEAATMLCRNLMLQPLSGEDLAFTDSRLASSWSRGYIKAAAEEGILRGDPEGTFRPLDNITRGEVAIMLVRVIGTPIQTPGTYSNSVSGNLMVSCSGVTLENMTVTGDLYITGGVGLGYVTLSNVTVYGKIIASGAGESNQGDCSIILKNCTAPEMIVDSPSNQYVTIRSVGNTDIDKVYVRTNAYLEGKSTGEHGFQYIEVDGEDGTQLDLAGNIHEVVTVAPESEINVGSGTVEKMTIDETAVNSTVTIAQGAVVEELNLDTGTTVTGKGDIGTLNVNAPGCKVEMLPDDINIRPGITADINGTTMDSTLADQISDNPRILSGYPRLDDVAPTQVEASFMTNKPGTIYWAVRLSGDGPMEASDLIKPPSYGANIVKSGKISVKDANEALSQKVTGLKIDTSYVLSAVLVDTREDQSLVKTVYFTTPDNSKPSFASGYPKASTIEDTYIDFDVATTKNCTLYWAVYKKGMPAPTANDFKSGTLSGAIDSGTMKMIRSEEDSVRMGSVIETAKNALAEMTEYDAFFFLSDSINDSSITKISFETADRTPPEFLNNYPRISKIDRTALTGEAAINEDGKVYWAIVKHGADYPVENAALTDDTAKELDKKLQIKGGMYALKSGSFSAKENIASSFNMSGLEPETAYDIYFVAEDDSGNLSEIKTLLNAKTLDQSAPELVELRFSQANEAGDPLADTDITLVFSEDIYSTQTKLSLVEMYASDQVTFSVAGGKDGETVTWAEVIRAMFTLNNLDITDPDKSVDLTLGDEAGGSGKENMTVTLNEEGQTEVTFHKEALNLLSGTKYQFVLNFITDSSNNVMPRNTKSKEFRVMDAQVDFNELQIPKIDADTGTGISVDATFSMIPYANSTANASALARYDLIIASDTTISFDLYCRPHTDDPADNAGWTKMNKSEMSIIKVPEEKWSATSYNHAVGNNTADLYPLLREMDEDGFDFAIDLTSINESEAEEKWDAIVNLYMFCAAGNPNSLSNLIASGLQESDWQDRVVNKREVSSIGNPADFRIEIVRSNQSAPNFNAGYPRVSPGDSITTISYQLDREGDLYYVVAPKTNLPPKKRDGTIVDKQYNDPKWEDINANGTEPDTIDDNIINLGKIIDDSTASTYLPSGIRSMNVASPTASEIMNPSQLSQSAGYRTGMVHYSGVGTATFNVENLAPNAQYYVYFVLKGSYMLPSEVLCYKFSTTDVNSPILIARSNGANDAYYNVSSATEASINVNTYWALHQYATGAYPDILDATLKNGKYVYEAILDGTMNDYNETITWATIEYGADEFRELLWAEMEGGVSGNPTAQGDFVSLTGVTSSGQDVRNFIQNDPEHMKPGVNYILLVAAKNQQGGSPVFSAVTNIHYASFEYPLVSSVSTEGEYSTTSKAFNGFVTVSFNDPLYVLQLEDGKTLYPYKARENDAMVTGSGSANVQVKSSTYYGFTIMATNFPLNGIINLIPTYHSDKAGDIDVNSLLYSKVGTPRPAPFSLRLEGEYSEDGTLTRAKFVIADGGIGDGFTSETKLQ